MELTREALLAGYYPITPHLYMPVCLDDTKPDERMIGTGAALALLERCDAVMIGKRYGISEGMAAEITKATDIGIPTFAHSERTLFKQLTIQCDMSTGFPKTTVFVDNKAVDRIEELSFTHEAGWDPMLTMKRTRNRKKLNLKGEDKNMKPIDYLNNANIHNYLFKLLGRRKFRKLRSAIENDQEIIISGISGVVAGKTTLTSVLRKMGCKVKEEPDTFLLYLENSIVDPIPNLIKLLFEESKEGEADGTGKEL